jgi:hypothetical protein
MPSSRRSSPICGRRWGAAVAVHIEVVDDITPAASGKFRWVVSDVSALARQTVEAQNRSLTDAAIG